MMYNCQKIQAYRTNDNQHHGDLDPRVLGLINQPKQIDETDDMEFSLTQVCFKIL